MLHIFNNPKLGHTVGKNVCSRLVLGKCVATLRDAFFALSMGALFYSKEKTMEDNIFNRMKQETENLSKEKLLKMSDKEIEDKAKEYKKIRIRDYSILTIIAALAYIVFFCCLPLIMEGEPLQPGLIIIFVLVAIGTISLFPIFLI